MEDMEHCRIHSVLQLQKFSVMIGEIEEGSATAIRNLEEMASKCQEKVGWIGSISKNSLQKLLL